MTPHEAYLLTIEASAVIAAAIVYGYWRYDRWQADLQRIERRIEDSFRAQISYRRKPSPWFPHPRPTYRATILNFHVAEKMLPVSHDEPRRAA